MYVEVMEDEYIKKSLVSRVLTVLFHSFSDLHSHIVAIFLYVNRLRKFQKINTLSTNE